MIRTTTIFLTAILFSQLLSAQVLVKRDTIYPEPEVKEAKEKPEKPKSQVETLFQGQKSFGGYFAINMAYSTIGDNDAFSTGGRLMFVANHYLGIGFGGKGFYVNSSNLNNLENELNLRNAGYGGLYLEPVFFSLKAIHVAMPILLGAGGQEYTYWTEEQSYWDEEYFYKENHSTTSLFFIVEPGLDVEFNIAKWFRIGMGASYRFTTQEKDLGGMASSNFNGFNYGITFKMGYF